MCAADAAGRWRSWRALAARPDVVKTQRPCRKCPSTPLILGSPLRLTVASANVFMPVSSFATSRPVKERVGWSMMLRRCSVATLIDAASRASSSSSSPEVSSIPGSFSPHCPSVEWTGAPIGPLVSPA